MSLADLTEALKLRFLHPVSGLALSLNTLKQRLSIINRFLVYVRKVKLFPLNPNVPLGLALNMPIKMNKFRPSSLQTRL